MKKPIYLDNHSTTKLDPRVLDVMMPYLTDRYGNSSVRSHSYGWQAEEAVDTAREQVAKFINADAEEIVFTSGATESNNIVLNGYKNVMISAIEHSSVHSICQNLISTLDNEALVREIKVNRDGELDLRDLKYLLTTITPEIVSVMLVNNEVGTIQPIKKVKEICSNILVHSDMAQALGKVPIDVKDLCVDFASFSAHKVYGPKGVGALYITAGKEVKPLAFGGGHERCIRPGTLNVPGIVGFGKACEIAGKEMEEEVMRLKRLRGTFFNIFVDRLSLLSFHGHEDNIPGNLNVPLPCWDMDAFMANIANKVAVSFGAACDGDKLSRTLQAMKVPDAVIQSSVRICFGRFNTEEEVIRAAHLICDVVEISNGG